jgi:hypothetical protein
MKVNVKQILLDELVHLNIFFNNNIIKIAFLFLGAEKNARKLFVTSMNLGRYRVD